MSSAQLCDVTIVIPVFNEKENLAPLINEIEGVMVGLGKSFEILVIDDASGDGSQEVLRGLAAEKPFMRAIFFRRNCGQSAAFDAGFRYANGRVIVTMDGDRQNDPSDIPAMLSKLEDGCDFVTGWRKNRRDGLLLRKIPSLIANAIIRAATGTKVHDLGCSLKAYRSEIASELKLYGEMHRFLSVLVELQGAKIGEIVVNHRERSAGKSKYGIGRSFKVVLDLLTVWFLRRFQTKPIYVFGGLGSLMFFSGMAISLIVLYEKYALGVWVHRNPLFQIAVMLILIGTQFVGTGIIAEILIRTYFESQNKAAYPIREIIGFNRK